MTDNVVNFPSEFNLSVDLEDDSVIDGVSEIIDIFTQGLNAAHDVEPEVLMVAMMQNAAIWGIRAGMDAEDVMDTFKRMRVRLAEEYDA